MMSSFKNNQSLPSLDLSFNRLMDDGVILLCRALADAYCNLLVLELAQCWFTSASCHALTSMLCSHLDLSKHIVGINGMLALALAIFSQRRAEEVKLKKKSNDVWTLRQDYRAQSRGWLSEDRGRLELLMPQDATCK